MPTVPNNNLAKDELHLPVYYRGEDSKLHQINVICPLPLSEENVNDCINQVIGELEYTEEEYKSGVLALIQGGKA